MKSSIMNPLKNLLLAFCLLAVTVSCKKDDEEECVPPALESHIVGTWQASVLSLSIPLTFTASGELQGDLGTYLALLPGVGAIDDLIRYEVADETTVNLIATSDGAPIAPFPLTVTGERTCERIAFASAAGAITLTQ